MTNDVSDVTPKRKPPREWRPLFLRMLKYTGNVRRACQAANISRVHAYRSRKQSVTFAAQWDECMEDAIDSLEEMAWERAKISDTLLIFLLKSHRPAVYAERLRVQLELQRAKDDTVKLFTENGMTEAEALAEVDAILRGR